MTRPKPPTARSSPARRGTTHEQLRTVEQLCALWADILERREKAKGYGLRGALRRIDAHLADYMEATKDHRGLAHLWPIVELHRLNRDALKLEVVHRFFAAVKVARGSVAAVDFAVLKETATALGTSPGTLQCCVEGVLAEDDHAVTIALRKSPQEAALEFLCYYADDAPGTSARNLRRRLCLTRKDRKFLAQGKGVAFLLKALKQSAR